MEEVVAETKRLLSSSSSAPGDTWAAIAVLDVIINSASRQQVEIEKSISDSQFVKELEAEYLVYFFYMLSMFPGSQLATA